MAISDFGICQDGEAVYECFGMHLPVLISDNFSWADSYRILYLDTFSSEFNKMVRGEHIPELVGQNFPRKVVEYWSEWMINPQIKYV